MTSIVRQPYASIALTTSNWPVRVDGWPRRPLGAQRDGQLVVSSHPNLRGLLTMNHGIGRLRYFLLGVVVFGAALLLSSAWKVTFFKKYFVWTGTHFVSLASEPPSVAMLSAVFALLGLGAAATIGGICMWLRLRNMGASPWFGLPAAFWPAGECLPLIGSLVILAMAEVEIVGPLVVRRASQDLVLESYDVVNSLAILGFVYWIVAAVALSTLTKTHVDKAREWIR